MRLLYGLCELGQEQKGVLEHPEHPPAYATAVQHSTSDVPVLGHVNGRRDKPMRWTVAMCISILCTDVH